MVYGPPGLKFCTTSIYKSFVFSFVAPIIPHRLWRLRGILKVTGLGRSMFYLLLESPGGAGSIMRQFWLLPKRVASVLGVMVWVLLHN